MRLLVGTPLHVVSKWVIPHFVNAIRLNKKFVSKHLTVDSYFAVNNSPPEFAEWMKKWVDKYGMFVEDFGQCDETVYLERQTPEGRQRLTCLAHNVMYIAAKMRNHVIDYAIDHNYDYIYFADPDCIPPLHVFDGLLQFYEDVPWGNVKVPRLGISSAIFNEPMPNEKTGKFDGKVCVCIYYKDEPPGARDQKTLWLLYHLRRLPEEEAYDCPLCKIKHDPILNYSTIDACGGGGFTVPRKVFERVRFEPERVTIKSFKKDEEPVITQTDRGIEAAWNIDRKSLGEDYQFGVDVKDAGFMNIAVPWLQGRHYRDQKNFY